MKLKPGLAAFTSSIQEIDRAYSIAPRVHTRPRSGQIHKRERYPRGKIFTSCWFRHNATAISQLL